MLALNPGEELILTVRRHWWVMVRPSIIVFLLLLIPGVAAIFLPALFSGFALFPWGPFGKFLSTLYVLALVLFSFVLWTNYYLDAWIITDRRIIDIEQKGIFDRTISEFPLDRVQNVSIQIEGIIETILKFGDLKVETASKDPFVINDIPHLYEAKDAIMRYASQPNSKP